MGALNKRFGFALVNSAIHQPRRSRRAMKLTTSVFAVEIVPISVRSRFCIFLEEVSEHMNACAQSVG
jgi:hypothetical protein